jgi:F-type H+-transporting ATPase subunit a
MAGQNIHVSISAEPVFHVGNFPVSNSIFTSLFVSLFLVVFALVVRAKFKNTNRPSSFQNVVEFIVEALYGFVHSITENTKKTKLFLPLIATFFLFIMLNNYVGLLPGVGPIMVKEPELHAIKLAQDIHAAGLDTEEGHAKMVPLFRAATADLNTTLALAIIAVVMTQVFGVMHLGLAYFKKFFDFSSPIGFFVGILELILETAKIISFAFRLFGNIFAGEVLLIVMTYLVAVLVPAPFYALELFVGFIQALVFSMLSLLFFNLATKSHHDEEHHEVSEAAVAVK